MIFLSLILFNLIGLLLLISSVQDLRKREVSNWLSYGIIGLCFISQVYVGAWFEALVGGCIGFIAAAALFHLKALGGADCKIIIGLTMLVFGNTLLSAKLFGSLLALGYIYFDLYKKFRKRFNWRKEVPFVPIILISYIIMLVL